MMPLRMVFYWVLAVFCVVILNPAMGMHVQARPQSAHSSAVKTWEEMVGCLQTSKSEECGFPPDFFLSTPQSGEKKWESFAVYCRDYVKNFWNIPAQKWSDREHLLLINHHEKPAHDYCENSMVRRYWLRDQIKVIFSGGFPQLALSEKIQKMHALEHRGTELLGLNDKIFDDEKLFKAVMAYYGPWITMSTEIRTDAVDSRSHSIDSRAHAPDESQILEQFNNAYKVIHAQYSAQENVSSSVHFYPDVGGFFMSPGQLVHPLKKVTDLTSIQQLELLFRATIHKIVAESPDFNTYVKKRRGLLVFPIPYKHLQVIVFPDDCAAFHRILMPSLDDRLASQFLRGFDESIEKYDSELVSPEIEEKESEFERRIEAARAAAIAEIKGKFKLPPDCKPGSE